MNHGAAAGTTFRKASTLWRCFRAWILALRRPRLTAALLISCLGTVQSGSSAAEIYVAGPDNYLELLKRLTPGDHLRLKPGVYAGGLPLRGITGAADTPIIIEGPLNGAVAVFRARPGANTINLADSSHLIVKDLILDGDNLPVDAIVTERHSSLVHHITLERLTIIGHGHDQSIVAIGTRCTTAFWTIRGNTIIGAGTGMYLGGSDGSAPFVAGVIEGNVILNTIGYNVEIKHQRQRPSLPQLPQAPQSTAIRGNFFSKSLNASQGERARPNLLMGHLPLVGAGSEDKYEVTHNVFYDNPAEVLLQGEGNLLISDNVFINLAGSAIAIRPHNDLPRQIEISRNFIAATLVGVSVAGGDPGYKQLVESNSIFAKDPAVGGSQLRNVTGSFAEASDEIGKWFALEGKPKSNDRLNWTDRLERMATKVCAIPSFLAVEKEFAPAGPKDRNCQFLETLFREAKAHTDN